MCQVVLGKVIQHGVVIIMYSLKCCACLPRGREGGLYDPTEFIGLKHILSFKI